MLTEISDGLKEPPRSIPPKYFYDTLGSQLFDRICRTPEYYLTRVEEELLSRHGADIINRARPAQILELGSGVSRKIRLLLDPCPELGHSCEYAPFDVCEEIVYQAAYNLALDYPWLRITPMIGDFHAGLDHMPATHGIRLLAFLGSSIGNFTRNAGIDFISDIRKCLRTGDYFLLGADNIKSAVILNAAYNDAEGVTAEFNLNILRVVNYSLNADFDIEQFSHQAIYNETLGQVEMYLVATRAQEVHIGKAGIVFRLAAGEHILTEISRKYTTEELVGTLDECGFQTVCHYRPTDGWYSLVLAQAC